MKPDAQLRNYQSTVEGSAVKMSIDDSATAHIMDVLTKLYSDPELACIREYSTNALDSHIEAGVNRPIEVTSPTSLAPFLSIRDYGIGLDADGIENIYSRYGTSTKRGSNDAVGMLGLGCKSALAYTDQFTLTGFKDGTRTEVLISRDEDGAGSMTIVAQAETTEGNGVKVTIPVKRDNDVADKARDFFRFWDKGTVLVNGEPPDRIGQDYDVDDGYTSGGDPIHSIWLDERTLLTNEVDKSLVVMGNVPYALVDGEPPLFQDSGNTRSRYNYTTGQYEAAYSAVCFVDIGDVNFAPSRESLMTTKRTKAKLAELRAKITLLRDKAVLEQIANAPDAKTAQQLLQTGKALGFKGKATWKGQEVVLSLKRERPNNGTGALLVHTDPNSWDAEDALKYSYLFAGDRYMRKTGERKGTLSLDVPKPIFTGFDGKILTSVKRLKLEQWASDKGIDILSITNRAGVVLVDKLSKTEKFWTTGWDIYSWADVAAVELPKTVLPDGSFKRLKGSYNCIDLGKSEELSADALAKRITSGTPVYRIQGNVWAGRSSYAFKSGAVDPSTCILVCLPSNRVDKFVRDFPNVQTLEAAARTAAERWVKRNDTKVVTAHAVKELVGHSVLTKLKASDVDDPELKLLLEYLAIDTTNYALGLSKFVRWLSTPKTEAKKIVAAQDKYKLLPTMNGYAPTDHIILYLNAAHAA